MNAPRRLIIDGVSGAGKSQTLAALKSQLEPVLPGTFIYEEETLGEFMGEELSGGPRKLVKPISDESV